MSVPMVGQIVHYVDEDGDVNAAIIVKVWDADAGIVTLRVFAHHINSDLYRRSSVKYSKVSEPHTWHWMEDSAT